MSWFGPSKKDKDIAALESSLEAREADVTRLELELEQARARLAQQTAVAEEARAQQTQTTTQSAQTIREIDAKARRSESELRRFQEIVGEMRAQEESAAKNAQQMLMTEQEIEVLVKRGRMLAHNALAALASFYEKYPEAKNYNMPGFNARFYPAHGDLGHEVVNKAAERGLAELDGKNRYKEIEAFNGHHVSNLLREAWGSLQTIEGSFRELQPLISQEKQSQGLLANMDASLAHVSRVTTLPKAAQHGDRFPEYQSAIIETMRDMGEKLRKETLAEEELAKVEQHVTEILLRVLDNSRKVHENVSNKAIGIYFDNYDASGGTKEQVLKAISTLFSTVVSTINRNETLLKRFQDHNAGLEAAYALFGAEVTNITKTFAKGLEGLQSRTND